MTWRRPANKPLSEPMMVSDAYMRHLASMRFKLSTVEAMRIDK